MLADVVDAIVKNPMDINEVKSVRNSISNRLITAKDSGNITTDQFLTAGKIEGGLDVIIAMLENQATTDEIKIHVDSILERIQAISE